MDRSFLKFRHASLSDIDLYFNWANDSLVRQNSFDQSLIDYSKHKKWFADNVNDEKAFFYIFFNEVDFPIGQVRIEEYRNEYIIDISIDKNFRGKSYGQKMLEIASSDFFLKNPNRMILAYIKKENFASVKSFLKAGFTDQKEVLFRDMNCIFLIKKNKVF